jgi:thymidylate synthase
MKQYLTLLQHVLDNGECRQDRTGVGTLSLFGQQIRINLNDGFPLLTTKKLHIKSIIHELLWFLRGETNISSLNAEGVTIWNEWADASGSLGPIYGHQWRAWHGTDGKTHDQISNVIHDIKHNPYSRRLIVSAWNVGDLSNMRLPPCHCLFQFYVSHNKLSCHLYQRSADMFLGVPFNIASYALLTCLIAHVCDLEANVLTISFGDLHLYKNHVDKAYTQLTRDPRQLPKLHFVGVKKDVFSFVYRDICILGYEPHPSISAPIAV